MSNSVRPHRQQPTRFPYPWDSPGKNTGVGCHFLLQCMKVKSEREVAQSCPTPSNPMDCSLLQSPWETPPSMGFSRQEYLSGVPLPSSLFTMHFAFSYCSWGSQGKNAKVVCHSLLYFAYKDLYSQSYDFSSSHVWM